MPIVYWQMTPVETVARTWCNRRLIRNINGHEKCIWHDTPFFFWGTKTRCLEENEEKHERKRKTRKKKENNREAYGIPEDYAEELGPLLILGKRS